MTKVIILQNDVKDYRKPVYNYLAKDYEILILHSGKASVEMHDSFREILIPSFKFGPFYLHKNVSFFTLISKFDVVIAMFDLRWPTYLLPLFFRHSPKYILWGHRYSKNKLCNAVRDILMKNADKILLYGYEEIDNMMRRGIDPDKIVVAPNTIYVPNHIDHSEVHKSSILFVGRLQERKKVDLLIDTFFQIQGDISRSITLDIIGGGDKEFYLKSLVRKLGIVNSVFFHGPCFDHAILSSFFSKALVYASPGPVGLAAIHSLAYGVPVLTINNSKHGPEFYLLKDGYNSLIASNRYDFLNSLKDICNKPNLARKLGKNAYKIYSEQRTLDKMIKGFREAIEN